jgi:hypothetical protein
MLGPITAPYLKHTQVGPSCSPPFFTPLMHKQVCVLPFFFSHLTNLLFPLITTWTIVCMPTTDAMLA